MKNTKFISIILSAAVGASACAALSGCGERSSNADIKEPVIVQVEPTDVMPIETAESIVGYALVAEDTEISENGAKSVLYRTEPIGQADIVKVEVRQYSDSITKEEIYSEYITAKDKRSDAEAVDVFDTEAYVAYPSIHMYYEGYIISITAGSGSDEGQQNMLISFASAALGNLAALLQQE